MRQLEVDILGMVKILILGGGFGSLRCALDLEKLLVRSGVEFDITLVDRNSYHLFTPAIYEVASAYGLKKDPFAIQLKKTVCIPYADIFEGKKINFMEAEISGIDLVNKKVTTMGEHSMDYDYLVFGIGGETTDYNIPGVTDYANQFKTLDDALFINNKLTELAEQISSGQRTVPYNFIICGGGFTGIELAAELACCSRIIQKRCKGTRRCSNITVFEAGPKILPTLSDNERKAIKDRLTKIGVILMENTPIESVGPNFVKLKNGQQVEGDMIVWTAGIKPNRLLASIAGMALTPSGRITADENMRVKGSENIFAMGDNVEFIDPKTQKPVAAMAYVAGLQAKVVANNIFKLISGKSSKLKKYKPSPAVWVVPVGGKYSVAHLSKNIMLKGFMAWALRGLIDIKYFMSILPVYKAFKLYWEEVTVFIKND